MKIVVDNKIPHIEEFFAPFAEITLINGEDINPSHIKNADALLVRTATHVNDKLLSGSLVSFVGSATAGTDHLDINHLNRHNITWAHTPGANATAVAEYVLCCIAAMQQHHYLKKKFRAGVIGVGKVGSIVANLLQQMGCEILLNDPPRLDAEPHFASAPLTEFSDLDLICLHTPLTYDGNHPSHHLINTNLLKQLKPGCIILNAGRGAVIDTTALLKASHVISCLDVWENEPHIDLKMLEQATIATPHIAGYSLQAKHQATQMIWQAAANHFGWDSMKLKSKTAATITLDLQHWQQQCLRCYDPIKHTMEFKQTKNFSDMRARYPFRESL